MKRILMLFLSLEMTFFFFFFLNDVTAAPSKEELNGALGGALSAAKGLKGSVESVVDNGDSGSRLLSQ